MKKIILPVFLMLGFCVKAQMKAEDVKNIYAKKRDEIFSGRR